MPVLWVRRFSIGAVRLRREARLDTPYAGRTAHTFKFDAAGLTK